MTWRLTAGRYATGASPRLLETIHEPADVGIRWALPGGVQRVEVAVLARNKYDAYDRYRNHHSQRMILYDNACDKFIGGWVYEIVPDGRYVQYILGGPWYRHWENLYTGNDLVGDVTIPTDDTDAVIKAILTQSVPAANSDQTNIAATSLNVGAWHPEGKQGVYPGAAIAQLASMGNTSDAQMFYWLENERLNVVTPALPLAYLEASSTTANADWLIFLEDLRAGGLTVSRHIWNYKTNIKIGYGVVTGTHTDASSSATQLTDSAATFISWGVSIGDLVTNLTDGCVGEVANITSETVLQVHDLFLGTDNDFDQNDRYGIRLQEPVWTTGSTTTESTYWTVQYREVQPDMDSTQAAQYEDTLLALFDKPVLQQAFSVSAPRIRNAAGAKWPLWRVIMHGGGYVRLMDFSPDIDLLATSRDQKQTFRIVALDYTYADNTLRIVPDNPDARLDVMLNQAHLTASQLISSLPPPPPESRTVGGPMPPPIWQEGDSGAKGGGHGGGTGGHGGGPNIPPGFIPGPGNYWEWVQMMLEGGLINTWW